MSTPQSRRMFVRSLALGTSALALMAARQLTGSSNAVAATPSSDSTASPPNRGIRTLGRIDLDPSQRTILP